MVALEQQIMMPDMCHQSKDLFEHCKIPYPPFDGVTSRTALRKKSDGIEAEDDGCRYVCKKQ